MKSLLLLIFKLGVADTLSFVEEQVLLLSSKGERCASRGVRGRWEGRREEESRTEERKRVMREGDERAGKRE